PAGQFCGGRVIHEPSVQRTRAPTAGMKSIIHQTSVTQVSNNSVESPWDQGGRGVAFCGSGRGDSMMKSIGIIAACIGALLLTAGIALPSASADPTNAPSPNPTVANQPPRPVRAVSTSGSGSSFRRARGVDGGRPDGNSHRAWPGVAFCGSG